MSFFTIFVSIIISIVSAFCTVSGIGKIFAGATVIAMWIAIVIEIGRVTLVYNLHHYWEYLDTIKKATGIGMLLIACSISAMGIFGFLSNAHLEKTIGVTPIIQEIEGKEKQILIYQENTNNYKVNLTELKNIYGSQASDAGVDELIKRGYVTKAFNYKKEQQKNYDEIFSKITQEQEKISKLNNEITILKKQADSIAPELGPLKYIVKLFNVGDQDTAMIVFICMIMCVFDTLAMYLMIMGDWIGKLKKLSTTSKNTDTINMEVTTDSNIDAVTPLIEINENKNIKTKNNIDSSFKNIVKLIQTSNQLQDFNSYKKYLEDHPEVMSRLKEFLNTNDNSDIFNSVNIIINKENKNDSH